VTHTYPTPGTLYGDAGRHRQRQCHGHGDDNRHCAADHLRRRPQQQRDGEDSHGHSHIRGHRGSRAAAGGDHRVHDGLRRRTDRSWHVDAAGQAGSTGDGDPCVRPHRRRRRRGTDGLSDARRLRRDGAPASRSRCPPARTVALSPRAISRRRRRSLRPSCCTSLTRAASNSSPSPTSTPTHPPTDHRRVRPGRPVASRPESERAYRRSSSAGCRPPYTERP